MQTLQQELAAHPFFHSLEPDMLQLLAGCGSNMYCAQDQYLFREGDPANTFYVLREGAVALETSGAQHGTLTVETIAAGEVVGWSWLFPPYRWHFSGRAVEPVHAIALDGACLRGKCETDHDFGYAMMKRFASIIVERLQATRLQALDLYAPPREGSSRGAR